ncbi:NACHT domain-containing protein [Leptolyngbyaceae cyanobacterium CCMR0082]|uniref:NACHT domain-containing protein n=1 Tax=Adonisia turfae CCMR0082 TaxID=2304604 RepID=A0A6M0SHS3_9CYAN|nr:NACHT domain-containing protein [Adonisia turfae]NEZ68035.1 NACHT domain-containing protein [Adonisia turfae CCMR0082]
MLGDVINGIIGPIFDTTWNSLKSQYHEGLKDTELKQERLNAQRAIAQASAKYHQNYLERHCNIKVLPGLMKEGMPLDKIYTAVKFLRDSDLKYFSTLDNLEELYRESGNRRFRVGEDERQDGLTAANNEQYLMVLGGPGVGKSTFLRKLGLEALEKQLAHDMVPVFIELKSFRSEEMSLQQAISEELEISGFPYAESLVESMLSDGKMLLLLDGLDEVPFKQVDSVIEQMRDFCDRHSQNRFVTSCRIAAYKGGFNRFADVTMAEFDDEQIQEFVRRWFSSELDLESDTAKEFWELIEQPENKSAKELAQTPLLLTFLCLVYDRSQSLPPVRSDLYGKALDILLEDWAAEKRIKRDPIYQGLHTGLEKELLSEIAYNSFKDDQLFFSEQEITDQIATFLADTLDAPKYLDGAKVLEAIEVQQGILVERATNTYSFSHLTLQEYLAARYISSSQWLIEELVSEHLTDERWREVFLLVSGLAGRHSHELLLAMEQQANVFIREPKLQDLLQWAIDLSDSSLPSNQILASRAWLSYAAIAIAKTIDRAIINAISIACISDRDIGDDGPINSIINNALTIAIDRTSAMDDGIDKGNAIDRASYVASARAIVFSRTIANAVDYEALFKQLENLKEQISLENLEEQIPFDEVTSDKCQSFAKQLIETFLTFFHLGKELITFSPAEAQALDKYLYAVKLIINCKNAAVRVSRKEWEAIESRLLTAPDRAIEEDNQPT